MSMRSYKRFLHGLHLRTCRLRERTNLSHAKYYSKVFEKLKSNPQYAVNEKARLQSILNKGTVTSDKYGSFLLGLP